MGIEKIPYFSFKVQLYVPIQGLAVVVKKQKQRPALAHKR